MTTFPGSQRLVKGGTVLIDPRTSVVVRIISLQYCLVTSGVGESTCEDSQERLAGLLGNQDRA